MTIFKNGFVLMVIVFLVGMYYGHFWCGVIGTSASTEKGAKEYIPLLRQKRKEPKEYLYNKGLYIEQ